MYSTIDLLPVYEIMYEIIDVVGRTRRRLTCRLSSRQPVAVDRKRSECATSCRATPSVRCFSETVGVPNPTRLLAASSGWDGGSGEDGGGDGRVRGGGAGSRGRGAWAQVRPRLAAV